MLHHHVVRPYEFPKSSTLCERFKLELSCHWTVAVLLFPQINIGDIWVLNVPFLRRLFDMVEANQFEPQTYSRCILFVIGNLEHNPMRETKPVVSIQSTLLTFKFKRPILEINILILISFSSIFNVESFLKSFLHFLSRSPSNSSLFLLTQNWIWLILHK